MARLAIAIVAFALAGCGPSLPSQVKTRIEEFHRDFPVGLSLSEAEARVQRRRLPYTLRDRRKCAENAANTHPTYHPKGGACLFAFDNVGATWYGYEFAVLLYLFFDESGALAEREFREAYTFL
jgi:hypothetical protein